MRRIAGTAAVLPAMAEPTLSHQSWLCGWGSIFSRWVAAYLARRIERQAAVLLGAMSDRELKDIGLIRGEIEAAVRGAGPASSRANGPIPKFACACGTFGCELRNSGPLATL